MKEVTFGHSKSYINRMRKLLNNIGPGLWKGSFLRRMLLPFMLIFYFNCNAQTAQIPDSSFRNFLMTNYLSIMDTLTGDVIIAKADSVNGTLNCSNRNIKDLNGLQHFINIQRINCSNNQITNIPSLAGYNDSLVSFDCSNNQLSALPAFRSGAVNLKSVNCNNNLLYDLGNLGNLTGLDSLQCKDNYMVFNDLLFFTGYGLNSFVYAPQFNSQVSVPSRVELKEGDVYIFPYPQFDTTYTINHKIFKNSLFLVDLQNADTFKISSVKSTDAGFYSWQLTDTLLPALIFTTNPQELVVVNENTQIFTPDGDGKNDSYIISCDGNKGIYDKSGKLLKEFQGTTAYWDGTDLHGKPVPTGVYMIRCGEKVESSVTLIR
jgi:gliding motility-associated-like protein